MNITTGTECLIETQMNEWLKLVKASQKCCKW